MISASSQSMWAWRARRVTGETRRHSRRLNCASLWVGGSESHLWYAAIVIVEASWTIVMFVNRLPNACRSSVSSLREGSPDLLGALANLPSDRAPPILRTLRRVENARNLIARHRGRPKRATRQPLTSRRRVENISSRTTLSGPSRRDAAERAEARQVAALAGVAGEWRAVRDERACRGRWSIATGDADADASRFRSPAVVLSGSRCPPRRQKVGNIRRGGHLDSAVEVHARLAGRRESCMRRRRCPGRRSSGCSSVGFAPKPIMS